jgi:hypothetical protein
MSILLLPFLSLYSIPTSLKCLIMRGIPYFSIMARVGRAHRIKIEHAFYALLIRHPQFRIKIGGNTHTLGQDSFETPILLSCMYHGPEGWYDPSPLLPVLFENEKFGVDRVGARINAETCDSIATRED